MIEHRRRYVDARPTIQRIVENTIRPMPQVLIDTETGRLQNKQQQADAFKALPIYSELVLSMTTELDEKRIQEAVKTFYRYVMLSHKWEIGEPLLQQVENISIYDGLEASPGNVKLQKFCLLVRYFHLRWAWSDTCCIDKLDKDVLQESLVAMFSWYRGSSLTVVYLLDVPSERRMPGALQGSIWNTRAWTYQEYVAAEIILFYTGDWKPYLGLTLSNHKESPEVISEMQQATGVSAQEMAVLRPGLDRVREKLYLASMRQAFRVEDTAYSLIGIFNVAIQANYGEGDRAVGRLLGHILTGSGDVTVLAWTGTSGDHNSCLPRDLTVYNLLAPPHIPRPIEKAEMDNIITGLRSSLPNLSTVMTLYKRLHDLPPPSVAACRMKLPGIICSITNLVHSVEPLSEANPLHTYRATTTIFGNVEIKTAETLPGMKALRLVHPWIRALLDQEHLVGAGALDESTQALRFVARLRQPFGALLFERKSRVEYKRVAADCLIMTQVSEKISLDGLMGSIGTIEVH